jgi:hypothetical protein
MLLVSRVVWYGSNLHTLRACRKHFTLPELKCAVCCFLFLHLAKISQTFSCFQLSNQNLVCIPDVPNAGHIPKTYHPSRCIYRRGNKRSRCEYTRNWYFLGYSWQELAEFSPNFDHTIGDGRARNRLTIPGWSNDLSLLQTALPALGPTQPSIQFTPSVRAWSWPPIST